MRNSDSNDNNNNDNNNNNGNNNNNNNRYILHALRKCQYITMRFRLRQSTW